MTEEQKRLETALLKNIERQCETSCSEKNNIPDMAQTLIDLWEFVRREGRNS